MTSFNYDDMKGYLKELVLEQIDISRNVEDDEVYEIINENLTKLCREYYVGTSERERMATEIFNAIRKLDIIQELVDDSDVTEIMVNGTDNIFIERKGRLYCWEKCFSDKEKLLSVIQQIVAKSNRVVNESTPIVDARLSNGSRVHVVLPPIALNGPILTIRRFPDKPINMQTLVKMDSISQEAADFLNQLVKAGYNIFISGGTGSGKTTFLNALSEFIPKEERIITIEDSAELQIRGIDNLVSLETRNENVEGCKEISIRDLIKASLRMRPDRIIVGEVRGGEAIDMIQAYNTGHDGSLSTGHANSAGDMLTRLETMMLMGMSLPLEAIRRQIASGIDIIVHLGRLRDKSRRVLEISEVTGFFEGEICKKVLYEFEEEGEGNGKIKGGLAKRGELTHKEKLYAAGLS